ncbi:MAG: hypothetical protein QG635_498, partial [Bacteroidota bacterium]|nr:hypothetical protein [Bacteroidota bacterium]
MNNRNIRMITGLFVFILIPTLILPAALDPALQARCIALSSFLLIISIMYYSGKLSRDAGKFKNAAMLCFSGFIAVSLLSAVTALNSSEWLFHSAYFIILFILFAYYLLLYDVPGLIDTISGFAVISCIFISSIAIFQLYGWGFSWLPGNMGPYSTMVRRNMLASWLLLSLPFVFYSLLKASGKWRIIAFIAFTELAFVLFACQSRAAWLGAAAFMVCAVIIYLIIIKTGSLSKTDSTKYLKNSGIAAGIAIIIIVFGSIGGFRSQQSGITTQGSNPAARAASIMKFGSDTSARQRILAWKRSLKMSGDNLWLGVGLGNWKLNMNKYGIGEFYPDVQSGYVLYLQPHNDFLSVLCETGIFGLLFYIGILLSGFLYGIKAAFRNNNFSLFGLLGASAIAGYSVFAFFDFPKDRIEQQILLLLIIALTVSSGKRKSAEQKPIAKRNFIIPGLISLILIPIFIIKLNSEIYIKDAIIS